MIDETVAIVPGMVVVHDEGLRYEVEDTRLSTNGYEKTHQLGAKVVNYTQLEDGSFPAGTKWSKDEEGFREAFTLESEAERTTAQAFVGRLLAHASESAERDSSNELYAEAVRSNASKVEELLTAKTGKVAGVAASWTNEMQPLLETLLGRSIEGEPLGAFKDYVPTALNGIYARARIVSVDEMFGPSLILDVAAEDGLAPSETNHDETITVVESKPQSEFIRWVVDPESGDRIAITAFEELRKFGEANGMEPHQITRVGNAVLQTWRLHEGKIRSPARPPELVDYLFEDASSGVIGLRVTKLDEMLKRIVSGEFKIKHINVGGLAILSALRDELATALE